jgi:hypothetical protein
VLDAGLFGKAPERRTDALERHAAAPERGQDEPLRDPDERDARLAPTHRQAGDDRLADDRSSAPRPLVAARPGAEGGLRHAEAIGDLSHRQERSCQAWIVAREQLDGHIPRSAVGARRGVSA